MISNPTISSLQRDQVIKYCKELELERVLDVGGSRNPWAQEVATHYFDQDKPSTPGEWIQGDIDNEDDWKRLDCNTHMFDFVICTQTLEHTRNPEVALKWMPRVGLEGFIATPNKYVELLKGAAFGEEGLARCNLTNYFRGFHCHRWIFSVIGGALWCFPKLSFVEYMQFPWLEKHWASMSKEQASIELSFRWDGSKIPYYIVSDRDIEYPDPQKAIEFYDRYLQAGL